MVGGRKCTCGDILAVGVVHHSDGKPCYVITNEDLYHIIDGVTNALVEEMHEDNFENVRPCDRTFVDSAGNQWTPELINKFASKAEALATYICENEKQLTKSDIVRICDGVRDNWKRYWASC